MRDVIIIGSGPAGLTSAIYTARAMLNPLVITGFEEGGQLMLTTDVENYPGFPDGIQGPELIERMKKQAEKFGAEFVNNDVIRCDFSTSPLKLFTENEVFETKTVIIATGASAKWLGLPSETRLRGRGVSSCATCDGFFYRDKKVIVIGGGDTAMEDAIFLTRFASSVTVVHRRDKLRASKILQDRARKNEQISFIWNSVVEEILGEERVRGVLLRNLKTEEKTEFYCDGVFVAIGHKPNTEIFKGQIELDEKGYIKLYEGTRTSVEGVFAAGDVHDFSYRQAITAAGYGCRAAMDVERYLESHET